MAKFTQGSASAQFTGKAGEHAVASELLVRGIPVHIPIVDVGCDLIAGERVRIQVKSARLFRGTEKSRPMASYMFSLGTSAPNWKNGCHKTIWRDWSKVCDFIICWGVDERRFWVIPTNLLSTARERTVTTLHVGGPRKRWTVDQEEVRALVATGLSQRDAAKRLGISEMSVSRACNFATQTSMPTISAQFDKYENAWHEIISAVGLTNQIDAIDQEFEQEFGSASEERESILKTSEFQNDKE